MARISDLSDTEELIARLEWILMGLSGTSEEEGLLAQLDHLLKEGDSPSDMGLLNRLEIVYKHGEKLLSEYAKIADVIEQPINDEQQASIKRAVSSGIKGEMESLKGELDDVLKAARLASESITESASKADMVARKAQSDLLDIDQQLQQTVPAVSQQLRAMVSEIDMLLTSEKLKEPLEKSLKEVLGALSIDHHRDSLNAAWREALDGFSKSLAMDMQQHREAIETLLVESQQEQIQRVKRIIDTRTPSDTIIELFDELDRAKAKIAQYEDGKPVAQKVTGKDKGLSAVVWVWIAGGVTVGSVVGVLGTLLYLQGMG